MSERQTCYCTHDASTHYRDGASGERFACLAMGCECAAYADARLPKPKVAAVRPARHPAACRCARCKAWLAENPPKPAAFDPNPDDESPKTDPYPMFGAYLPRVP